MSESKRERQILNRLLKEGFSAEQASGIVGSLKGENDTFTPNRKQKGGPAFGIAQWEGPRKRALMKRKNPKSMDTQLDFLMEELNTTERGAMKRVKKTKTAQEAGQAFTRHFERPRTSIDAKRRGIKVSKEEKHRGEMGEKIQKRMLEPNLHREVPRGGEAPFQREIDHGEGRFPSDVGHGEGRFPSSVQEDIDLNYFMDLPDPIGEEDNFNTLINGL